MVSFKFSDNVQQKIITSVLKTRNSTNVSTILVHIFQKIFTSVLQTLNYSENSAYLYLPGKSLERGFIFIVHKIFTSVLQTLNYSENSAYLYLRNLVENINQAY